MAGGTTLKTGASKDTKKAWKAGRPGIIKDVKQHILKGKGRVVTPRLGGRTIAKRQRMVKAEEPGEWTEISVNDVEYEIDLNDSLFTLSNLRNPRD